ncbi:MAG: hypothetical protein ACKOTE_02445, partial [Opitutaceae bacterium]
PMKTSFRVRSFIAGLVAVLAPCAPSLVAARHHRRSGRFFYGMLAAQLAVIVSTFALAARRRTLLWTIAAGAGAVALAFTVYVLLFV